MENEVITKGKPKKKKMRNKIKIRNKNRWKYQQIVLSNQQQDFR